MTPDTTKKRIMREFTIGEISAVDRPAQAHAKMTIMKRAGDGDGVPFNKVASFASLAEAVAHLRSVHGLSGTQAMEKAARAHPDLVTKYNAEGRERVVKAASEAAEARASKRDHRAAQEFHLAVDGIAEREGVPRSVAMSRARRRHPDLFRAYQGA